MLKGRANRVRRRFLGELFLGWMIAVTYLVVSTPLHAASSYAPTGLYDVVHKRLDNGMRVIFKHRPNTRNVSLRLGVRVGFRDFDCEKQEVPHFLEHLMFTGTSQHDEYELGRLVEDHGGYANATTRSDETIYIVDIHSQHADIGIKYLHEIITDSQLEPEDVELSRAIVTQEAGEEPSRLRRWLFERDIGKSGSYKAWELTGFVCNKLSTTSSITRDELLSTYKRYYQPENMVLSIVGDIEPEAAWELIDSTFGSMSSGVSVPRPPLEEIAISGPVELTGTLEPIVDTDGDVGVVFAGPPARSDEIPTMVIMAAYLSDVLHRALRIETGLSYGPNAGIHKDQHRSVFYADADTAFENMDRALKIIKQQVDRLVSGDIDAATVEKIKMNWLLSYSQGYETNESHADYYLAKEWQLRENGALTNSEALVQAVTADGIVKLAKKYLAPTKRISYRDEPTISYDTLIIAPITLLVILSLLIASWWYRIKVMRNQ